MYNRNYYAQVDDAMMKLWKDFGCTNTSTTPSPENWKVSVEAGFGFRT